MSNVAEKKEALKKHVRALLVSSPVELTVKELLNDFHMFIGIPLDFKGIGYATVEDFLRDIEDAVYISWKNGMMTLKANSDGTDKHIAKLVSKQKVNNKGKFAVYRTKRPPRISSGPPRYDDRFRSAGHQAPPKRIIPAYARHQVEGLFRSFSSGLLLYDVDAAFGRKYGTRLNYRNFGFDTMLELFQSLSSLVRIHYKNGQCWILPQGVTSNNREEPSRRSTDSDWRAQRSSTQAWPETQTRSGGQAWPETQTRSGNQTRSNTQAWPNTQTRSNTQAWPEPQTRSDSQAWSDTQTRSSAQTQQSSDSNNNKRPSKGRGRRRQESGDSEGGGHVGHDVQSVTSSGSGGSSKSRSDRMEILEQEIRQILERKPNGMWAARLPYEYSDLMGKPLDYRDYGYLSVVDFIASMPDTVRIERPSPKGDWMLYDARIAPLTPAVKEPATTQSLRTRHTSGKSLLEETQEWIQQVLKSRPYGIHVNQFPEVYKEFTGHDLPAKELGFEAANQLCLSMADSILQVAYIENVGTVLFLQDADINNVQMEVPQEPQHSTDSSRPADAVGPGCHYIPVPCPDTDQYTGMYVSNIINPGLFWVILRHRDMSLALENLMDRLDEVYSNSSSQDYQMPESLIVPGQVCATLFPEDNNWHRGVITGTKDTGFISVYFVDYGNTSYVDKSFIRFLKREFLSLPAQAIQARLSNVHPPDGKWKVKSRNRLLELSREKALVAYVTKVQCQIVSVCLTDTNDPRVDVHINDVLVKEGFAIFCPDNEYPGDLTLIQHAEVPNYSHVFGTTEVPRLPHAAGDNAGTTTETPGGSREKDPADNLVRWVRLTKDQVLHIINLDRVAHVVSAEVSGFIWEEDILSSMLKQRKLDICKTVIDSDNQPGLFQDLARFEVKSMKAQMLGKKQFLSLYPLDSVPSILQTFLPDSEDLITALEELLARFDPDKLYWKNCEVTSNKPVEEEEVHISHEDKEMVLQALQIKRKRILQRLMSDPANTEQTVNDLNKVEMEILMIKQDLDDTSSNNSGSSARQASPPPTTVATETPVAGVPPGNSQACSSAQELAAENQRVIKNIMASSTKPIATANIMTKPICSIAGQTAATVTSQVSMPGMNQSGTGSYPDMMGLNTFAQQQRFVNPYMLAQSGMMQNAGMLDISQMLGARMPLGVAAPRMALGQQPALGMNNSGIPGLLPGLDPSLLQGTSMLGTQPMINPALFGQAGGQLGGAPVLGLGRGQSGGEPGTMGLLPGLMPLLQNLTLGRGAGRGAGQDPGKQ